MRARNQRKFSTRRTDAASSRKQEGSSTSGHPESSKTGEKQGE